MSMAKIGRRKVGTYQSHSRSLIADAARLDNTVKNWNTQPVHVDDLIYQNLRPIRARCRDAYVNNSLIKRYVGLMQRNVIGHPGIKLQMQVVDADGTTSDDKANEAIEGSFKQWSKRKHCEVTGKYSWLSIQLLWVHSLAIDGEFLARKIRGEGAYGFQWQVLDSELLDINHNERLDNGHYIRFGIEFNAYGRPLAYYLINRDQFNPGAYLFNGNKYDRVVADDIFHDFIPLFVGQKRGFPMPHAALYDLHQLKGYDEAALIAARIGASNMGFFTRSPESVDDEPAMPSGVNGDAYDNGDIPTDAEPGVMSELPVGVGFEAFNPDYPHSQYGEFTKSHQQRASSGLDNVSYHSLSNNLEGVSFSSIRTGTLEDREAWMLIQAHGIGGLCEETVDEWLPMSLLSGKIRVNGNILPFSKLEKFSRYEFQGRRWGWVDPLKDEKAREARLKMGTTSRVRLIREAGGDPETIAKERVQDDVLFPDFVSETEEKTEVKENA